MKKKSICIASLARIAAVAMMLLVVCPIWAQTGDLERVSPESQGVKSGALIDLFDKLTSQPTVDIHSVVVLRNGKVIGEIYPKPFTESSRHTLYSCSKTFVSAAIGIAIGENKLSLTDKVLSFFPEIQLPADASADHKEITVRNLLTMTAGIVPDWEMRNHHSDWILTYLSKDCVKPGSKFQYDSMCTYLLSAIVKKATGKNTLEYLNEKVFGDLGIKIAEWEISPEGYNTGGWGLRIQPESMAKFGQLILNGGKWNGKQLIPADWVKAMTSKQQEAGEEDYCYQMWQCEYPGAVRADGAYGQYIIVAPDKNIVVVVTQSSMVDGMKGRRIIWDTLMPAAGDKPLALDKDYGRLLKRQSEYALALAVGDSESSQSKSVGGKKIVFEKNKLGWRDVTLRFSDNKIEADFNYDNGDSATISFGYKEWQTVTTTAYPAYSIDAIGRFKGLDKHFDVAGSYGWKTGGALNLKFEYTDWISALDAVLTFDGDKVTVDCGRNYSKEPLHFSGKLER